MRDLLVRTGAALRSTIPLLTIVLAILVCYGLQLVTGGADGFFTRGGGLLEAAVDAGEPWRLVTSGFLHADWGHLVGNTVALVVLGLWLVKRIGMERTLWAYLVGLLAAGWGSMLLQSSVFAIGASGAVFGLAGTLFLVGVRQRTPIAIVMVGCWILTSVYMTFATPGIAWGAHLGGLAGGMAIGASMVADEERVVHSLLRSRLVGGGLALVCLLGALSLA